MIVRWGCALLVLCRVCMAWTSDFCKELACEWTSMVQSGFSIKRNLSRSAVLQCTFATWSGRWKGFKVTSRFRCTIGARWSSLARPTSMSVLIQDWQLLNGQWSGRPTKSFLNQLPLECRHWIKYATFAFQKSGTGNEIDPRNGTQRRSCPPKKSTWLSRKGSPPKLDPASKPKWSEGKLSHLAILQAFFY